jgi:hypothetical protein
VLLMLVLLAVGSFLHHLRLSKGRSQPSLELHAPEQQLPILLCGCSLRLGGCLAQQLLLQAQLRQVQLRLQRQHMVVALRLQLLP